jgi:Domain of unknown function (DUF4129)
MTVLLAFLSCLVLVTAQDVDRGQASIDNTESSVRTVLRQESYPWYDGQADQVAPLVTDPSTWAKGLEDRLKSFFDWLRKVRGKLPQGPQVGLGGVVPTLLFMVFGAALLVLLWRLWRLYEPRPAGAGDTAARVGSVARLAGLAPGAFPEDADPWAEALRRRAAGDAAGAVIWLFLDQLLALRQLGLIRLAPGRTARQYVLAVSDSQLRDGLRATLALFEEVYYGHRSPTPQALESIWARALAFRRRLETMKAGPGP